MRNPIILPKPVFDTLLANCTESQPEYETLINSFIMPGKEGRQEVHIPYDPAAAAELSALAQRVCPDAWVYISAAISEGCERKCRA